MHKISTGPVLTLLSLLCLLLNPASADTLPEFEKKLPIGTYAHVAPLGDGTPDVAKWSSLEYLTTLNTKIEEQGFEASTGLIWSRNLNDRIAMNHQSQLTLVAFELNVETYTSALLEISAAHGLAWYYKDHNDEVHYHVDNYRQNMAAREIFDVRPVIPIQLEPGFTYRVFVVTFVYTPGAVVSYNLWQPEPFRANRTAYHLTEGMFFGFAATLAVASLVLAVVFKKIVYLFFAGFVMSSSVTSYASSGFSLLFGIGDKVYLSVPLIFLSYGVTAVFANLFSMYFLDMWNTHKKLYWTYFGMTSYTLVVGLYPALANAAAMSFENIILSAAIGLIMSQLAHLYALTYYFKRNKNVLYWWVGMVVYSGSLILTMIFAGEPIKIGNLPQMTIVLDAVLLITLLTFNFKGEQASRRAAQQSSMENLRLARDLEKSRSTFVATVGHDLRGPVQAISHFTESLKQSADEWAKQRLIKIDNNILSISEMLDSMINLSRIDWQSSQPQVETVALRPILLELRTEFLSKAAEKHLELEIETPLYAVLTDRICLSQILRNLTDNAIKYTDEGYVRIRVLALESTIKIIVEDSGLGIPTADLTNIFREFYQVDKTADAKSGVGLGLSIVARLARLLDIRITVNSTAEQGSHFEIEIDRSKLPESEVPVSEAILSGMSKSTVALVSNEVDAYKDIAVLLKSWGVNVITAEAIPDITVDLIVIDEEARRRLAPAEDRNLVTIEPNISPMKLRRLIQRELNPTI